MVEDKLLIWKFKCGDSDALRRIYAKYKEHLLKLATALLNDIHGAEDVVHDVFVSFAQTGKTVKLNGSLKSYLTTSVVNLIRNRHLYNQRHRTVELADAEPISSGACRPDQWILCSEELKQLSSALAQLPYYQREVIILRMHSGVSFRQIAKLQDASINTVQSRYRYGLNKVRSILDNEVKR